MAKKSGGGAIGGIVLVGLAMLAAVPKEVWITIGLIALVGGLLYLFFGNKAASPESGRAQSAPPAQMPARQPRSSSALQPRRQLSVHPGSLEEPVSVGRASAPPSYSVPKAPAGRGHARWIAAGESITVAGTTLPGGMLYVGSALPTPYGGSDPALINPSLNVAKSGDYRERAFGYWPSYSEIPASARRAYLNWLADGRKDPTAEIGYVFLYFYGLERRAIIDAPKEPQAQADWPRIAAELKRLLAIYGGNNSFHGYATKLLSWVSLATYSNKLYLESLPEYEKTWEVPLHLRLVLGQCAVDQVPVPANVALEWARHDPNIPMRTPAVRCADQFSELFKRKYHEAFGSGMVLPANRTKLKFVYTPASAGFRGYDDINLNFGNVPDVTVLTGPVKKLLDVVEAATKELESYSRFLGRNPTQAASLDALLLLPATLWPVNVQAKMRELKARADKGMTVLRLQELLDFFGQKGGLAKDKLAGLARALESMNLAMEPDVLGGAKAPKPEDTVVLFGMEPHDKTTRDTPAYQAAVLTLELANAVAMADGDIGPEEMRQLRTQVEGWTHLTPAHQQRLRAHMRLLMDAPVTLAVLKKKLEPLEAGAKEAIAKFMAVIAQADGNVSPAEIKMLEKVYKVLGVDPKNVFTDVHAVAAGARPSTQISPAAGLAAPTKSQAAGFKLDAARIAALQQDTEQVSALLANIFKEEDVPPAAVAPVAAPDDDTEEQAAAPAGLAGLDEAHTSFVRMLLSRPSWSRQELLDVAEDLELMLDGALERINDASFDAHDAALTDGDDPVVVNQEILEKEPA